MDLYSELIDRLEKNTKLKSGREIAEITASHIQKIIGNDDFLISVRDRAGHKSGFMRSIYINRKEISSIRDANSNRIEVDRKYFSQDSENNYASYHDTEFISNVYKLKNKKVQGKVNNAEASFKKRIESFFEKCDEHFAQAKNSRSVIELNSFKSCLIVGRQFSSKKLNRLGVKGRARSKYIDQIVVIYTNLTEAKLRSIASKLIDCVSVMSHFIDFASLEHVLEFERKALQTITKITPSISKVDISSSQVVRTITDNLTTLLENYLVMINGKWDNRKGRLLSVTFMLVNQRKQSDEMLSPQITIYPENNTLVGERFEFSLPEKKSLSKSLLYLKTQHLNSIITKNNKSKKTDEPIIKFNAAFEKLFEGGDLPTLYNEGELSYIVDNSQTGTSWGKYNAKVNSEYQSILAYTLSKDSDEKGFPYGILAFECKDPYAFSDETVALVTELVRLVISLLGSIKLGDLGTDYQRSIRDLYAKDSTSFYDNNRGINITRKELTYDITRVDWNTAKDNWEKYLELKGESDSKISKDILSFFEQLNGQLDNVLSRDQYKNKPRDESGLLDGKIIQFEKNKIAVSKEMDEYLNQIQQLEPDVIEKFIEFLDISPSGIIWHCWLSSIRVILEARFKKGGEKELEKPKFESMDTGFSALELLMVRKQNEIYQAIKLGEEKKLSAEKEKYHKFVRYQILYAARIPQDGFAFECNGSGTSKYGALISDLVTGEDESSPNTLMDFCTPKQFPPKDKDEFTNELIKESIDNYFGSNLHHWYSNTMMKKADKELDKEGIKSGKDLLEYVARTKNWDKGSSWNLRLGVDYLDDTPREEFEQIFESAFKKIALNYGLEESDYNALDLTIKNLDDISSIFMDTAKKCIIHGDMNSRNLIWSPHYKRLFMIDFEQIKAGFGGADQINLLISMLCDLVSLEQFSSETSWGSNLKVASCFIKGLSRFVEKIPLILQLKEQNKQESWGGVVSELEPLFKEENIDDVDVKTRRAIYFELLLSIISHWPPSAAVNKPEKVIEFWKSAFRAYAFAQLKYAVQNLLENCDQDLTVFEARLKVFDSDRYESDLVKNPECASVMLAVYSILATR